MGYEEELQLENEYVMHTFARKPVEFVRGQGMQLWDDEGKAYLDFLSGIGVVSLGHCHPAIVEALEEQSSKLIHVSNYYYIEGRGELARDMSDLLNARVPQEERKPWQSFFANSGAEANECAIKLARLYAKKQARARMVAAGASEEDAAVADESAPRLIVTLDRSFHGRTLATLAATAQPSKQEAFQPLPDGFVHTPINDVETLDRLFEERGDDICAVLVEVVQGESGVHPCTKEFLQAARCLTEQYGALLICDEVQCGMYRCGTYPFAYQHFDVLPDVVTIAKGVASGMPMGMCAARAEVAGAFEPGDHGTTFGGSCLAVACAQATLKTMEEEKLGENAERVGAYLREQLSQLPGVVEVRGLGLMVAAELDEGLSAPDVVARGLEAGLVLNYTGPQTLRFLPPLICSTQDVDVLVERLRGILA